MAEPESVDLPEGMEIPADDHGDPGFQPDDRAPDDGSPAPPDAEGDDLPRDCAGLPLNDFGNGQRFVRHFGDDVIYVPRVGWFVWSGQRWEQDPDEIEVRRHAQRLGGLIEKEIPYLALDEWQNLLLAEAPQVRTRLREVEDLIEGGGEGAEEARAERDKLESKLSQIEATKRLLSSKKGEHRKFAKSSGNSGKIDAAMKESTVDLSRKLELLDAAALDVNCGSGVLRFTVEGGAGEGFSRTAKVDLLDHARDQLMTKMMAVKYDPSAKAPLFHAFLNRIQPDEHMRAFLQRWFGLSMTALTGEQKLCFFHGGGGNGKSVLVDLIARIMGDYASTAKIETLTGSGRRNASDATPDLLPLVAARFVRASEPDEGERLKEGLVKELTGGEPMLARGFQKDFFEFLPRFKLTISGNHKPDIRGLDDGIWRRVLLVPFGVQIPKAERDQSLGEKLWAERSGIFNWMIEGLLNYLEDGLREPDVVLDATREYREQSDPIGLFLDSACVVTGEPTDSLPTKDLVLAFNFWMDQRGEGQWKDRTISLRLKDKSRTWRSAVTGKGFTDRKSSGIMRYDGIRFSDVFYRDLPIDATTGRVNWKGARNG
ncbi:phage/plasmid primase, P4 family [Paracoccus sp. SSK6]|uniref:DNA primase family protein n=1 Tax=Paracoccus sp. SSK6 TaxID=3143131 RepID=UPI00321B6E4F